MIGEVGFEGKLGSEGKALVIDLAELGESDVMDDRGKEFFCKGKLVDEYRLRLSGGDFEAKKF